MSVQQVSAYVEKLTGESVAPDQAVKLSSLKRAALQAWLMKQAIPFDGTVLKMGVFTVQALLRNGAVAAPSLVVPSPANGVATGIGIDIQRSARLPEATDYRVDPFYAANFSPDEIAYCICQPDPRQSFSGLWAAKEAIAKTMPGLKQRTNLASIGIAHDGEGRPFFPGGDLSISHDEDISVAVFVARHV